MVDAAASQALARARGLVCPRVRRGAPAVPRARALVDSVALGVWCRAARDVRVGAAAPDVRCLAMRDLTLFLRRAARAAGPIRCARRGLNSSRSGLRSFGTSHEACVQGALLLFN